MILQLFRTNLPSLELFEQLKKYRPLRSTRQLLPFFVQLANFYHPTWPDWIEREASSSALPVRKTSGFFGSALVFLKNLMPFRRALPILLHLFKSC